jgi:hypothetical protein
VNEKAEVLFNRAAATRDRLERHLLVAAALRELLPREPIVVGGTAEEFWTADEYHETDLDLCVLMDPESMRRLRAAGFRREGRHWVRQDITVAVEFPESRIDGDESRTVLKRFRGGAARIIGVDDLYIDRLRQATLREDQEGIEYHSALAVFGGCFEDLDARYIRRRIDQVVRTEPLVGRSMRKIDSKIRRRVKRALTSNERGDR